MTKDADDDIDLFRLAMKNVRPLASQDKISLKPTKQQGNSSYRRHRAQLIALPSLPAISLPKITAQEKLSYAKPGLQAKQFLLLKQGHIPIEATLDLHSYTIDEALIALADFFRAAQASKLRCLNIIHGKGRDEQAYLKSAVLGFLKAQSHILAYHSAPSKLGGTGAVLVLLSNK